MEGNKSEGQDMAEANAEAQLAAEERAADTLEAAQYNPDAERVMHEAWDRAEALDRRGQNAVNYKSHTSRTARHGHHRAYSRQRTSVSNLAHPTHHTAVHWTDVEYSKGEARGFFGWLKWKLGW